MQLEGDETGAFGALCGCDAVEEEEAAGGASPSPGWDVSGGCRSGLYGGALGFLQG